MRKGLLKFKNSGFSLISNNIVVAVLIGPAQPRKQPAPTLLLSKWFDLASLLINNPKHSGALSGNFV